MKLSEKIAGKASRLPKFNADDTFRQKFVKYARWLGKSFPDDVSDVNGIDFCYDRLETLLPTLRNFASDEFSFYRGESFLEAKLEFDVDSNIAVKHILNNLSGASFYNDAAVFYNPDTIQSGGEIIVILSSCSAVNDGGSYNISNRNRTVRFMSIGYLILASELAERVISAHPEQVGEKTVFDWQNKYWDACPPVELYDEELKNLLDEELESVVSFNKHVKKRSIPAACKDKKVQDVKMNQSTLFNQLGFKKVEVDTETYKGKTFDYATFSKMEKDFQCIYGKLPQPKEKVDLRFRNLKGKGGVFYNSLNTIVIDLEYFNSFIHEYGHYVDYKHSKERYSSKKEFSYIASNYKEAYIKELEKEEDFLTKALYKRKKDYYVDEVEVFARAFELWVSNTIMSDTPLLKTVDEYKKELPYRIFDSFLEDVLCYFNQLFGNSDAQIIENKPVQLALF